MSHRLYTNKVPFWHNNTRQVDVFEGWDALCAVYGSEEYTGSDKIVFSGVRRGRRKYDQLPKNRTGYRWEWGGCLLANGKGWCFVEVPKKRRNRNTGK